MNIDTRYLIRWGIPGWIFMIFSSIYFIVRDFKMFLELFPAGGTSIVAIGAVLTVLGIPIGYLFNQIHHTITFVIIQIFRWDRYFKFESQFENYMFSLKEGSEGSRDKVHERYRYLLSRIHEIGSICIAIISSELLVIIWDLYFVTESNMFVVLYHITVILILVIMWIDRWYYKRNIEVFINFHCEKAGIKKFYRS
ncbi:hypothetical protein AWM68_07310 [Fictibacillus phosphorivorans]|uniref:Uncharacterized protein n=1 Tax=Fictibacillus phosphorivorans TaxID=1221500 RepID=A0A163R4E5_9BACL|nr:hypothetical protein [Fictibacillus phosphorivorans]KZE66174.1 hypothetical protein AWM68_07310 [Fictibacillus phosphorivorans]